MIKAEEYVGRTIGKLTVKEIKYVMPLRGYGRKASWLLCECSCGNKIELKAKQLYWGKQSCGCSQIPYENRIGEVFSRLTIESYFRDAENIAMYQCRCACGKELVRRANCVVQGNITSCGCARAEIIGRRDPTLCPYLNCEKQCEVGKLACRDHAKFYESSWRRKAALEGLCTKCGISIIKDPNNPRIMRCAECRKEGNKKIKDRQEIRKLNGLCIRCGKEPIGSRWSMCDVCSNHHQTYGRSLKSRFIANRRKCSRTNEWSLTFEEYVTVVSKPCAYCGFPPELKTGSGLDRKDNTRGYHLDNVVSCCKICNIVKNKFFSEVEMKKIGVVIRQIKLDRIRDKEVAK